MSGAEIRRLVQEFLAMIDEGPSPSDLDLVDCLDRLACAVHSIPSGEIEVDSMEPGPSYLEADAEARRAVSNTFSDLTLYNTPASLTCDIGLAECEVGDPVDDLVGLYLDLREVSFYFAEVSEQRAMQKMKWSFKFHWEYHLRNLQFYFYRRAFEAGEIRSA